jgi:outer membrane receptor protein involved in Fe transport
LDASVAHFRGNDNLEGETELGRERLLFVDATTNTWSDGFEEFNDTRLARTSFTLAATGFLGAHTMKVGAGFEDNLVDQVFDRRLINRFGPSFFVRVAGVSDGTVHNRTAAVYVQDSWRATDRFTVNAGVRWEGQYLIGRADSVAQDFPDLWQPRIGFVYLPGELGSQKIFGSYGRFYQQLPLELSAFFHKNFTLTVEFFDADPRDGAVSPSGGFDSDQSLPKVRNSELEHFDEFTLGYERAVGRDVRLSVRGVHRVLGGAFAWALSPDGNTTDLETTEALAGTPGSGDLSFLPPFTRRYSALELAVEATPSERLELQASYVLSRTHGNYAGLFRGEDPSRTINPGANYILQLVEQVPNSTGLLPNDRTHVLKAFGSYRFKFGLSAGGFFTWQSGTPLNEFGVANAAFGPFNPAFLVKRGSAGRTPPIWNLDLRFMYEPRIQIPARLILDLLHVGNPREVVDIEQVRFLGLDAMGNQTLPNPDFGAALAHQPPMTFRLGIELGF